MSLFVLKSQLHCSIGHYEMTRNKNFSESEVSNREVFLSNLILFRIVFNIIIDNTINHTVGQVIPFGAPILYST